MTTSHQKTMSAPRSPFSARFPSPLSGHPGVLGFATSRLAARKQRLVELAALHPPWKQQVAAFNPTALGRCLMVPEMATERLLLVHEANLQKFEFAIKAKRLITMPNLLFGIEKKKATGRLKKMKAPLPKAEMPLVIPEGRSWL